MAEETTTTTVATETGGAAPATTATTTTTADPAAEVARLRDELKKVIAKRDKWKARAKGEPVKENDRDDDSEEAALLRQRVNELQKQQEINASRAKNGAITAAATAKLSKMGVGPEGLKTALAVLSRKGIQYDPNEDVVDDATLSAAVSALQAEHPVLFVPARAARPGHHAAGDGSSGAGDDKLVPRDEWNTLSGKQQREKIMAGFRPAAPQGR